MLRFLADIRKEYGKGAYIMVFFPFVWSITYCGLCIVEVLYGLFT